MYRKNSIQGLLLLCLSVCFIGALKAQIPVYSYANGAAGTALPFSSNASNRVQWIVKPSYFPASPTTGNITTIYLRAASNATNATFYNFTVQMGNTSLNDFPSAGAWAGGLTTVYSSATQVFPSVTNGGWVQLTLQTPFAYSNSSNFVIDISHTGYSNGFSVFIDNSVSGAQMWGASNSSNATGFGSGALHFGFDIVSTSPCTSPPTAGTAVASATSVCPNTSIDLGLVGNSQGSGQTYQWQYATSSSGPYTNLGSSSTSPSMSGVSVTANRYFRAAVTCGASTTYATPVEITVGALLAAGTYTVNSASPTSGSNFNSFSDAVNAMSCGVTGPVVFNAVSGSGPYNEQVIISDIGNSAASPVTFNGNGVTVFYNSTNTNERAVIKLDGANYMTFRDFSIIPGGTFGYGFQLTNNADHNKIDSCTISGNTTSGSTNYAGIVMSGSATSATGDSSFCDYDTLTNNTISGGYYGVTMYGNGTSSYSTGNRIAGNVIKDFYAYGIYAYYQDGLVISDNEISRPSRSSVTTFFGVRAYYLSNSIIEKCRIHDPFANTSVNDIFYGLYLRNCVASSSTSNQLSNNIIYNVNNASSVYGLYLYNVNYLNSYYNTIALEDTNYSATSLTHGVYLYGGSAAYNDNILQNNNVLITGGGNGTKYGVYIALGPDFASSNNNNYYISSSLGSNYTGYYSGDIVSLSSWQSVTADEANSVNINPNFIASSTGNLTPQTSALNNMGTPVSGITTDIAGASRNTSTPDIGAFEFSPPVCTSPPTAGATIASSTSSCSSIPVNLSLSGNSAGTGQTYQWQSATVASGPYTNMGSTTSTPSYNGLMASTTQYYRAAVTCGSATSYSAPVQVEIGAVMPAGTYTINSGAATSGSNFHSFNDAVNAMSCGVAGAIVLNVANGSGPYNEQITLSDIANTATSPVTINGNGATVYYSATNTSERAVIKLNGADYITINNLNIVATGTAYGFGVQLINDADHNKITNCVITTTNTSLSTAFAGVVISGSGSSATMAGSYCDYDTVSNNTINGGYYGITMLGNTTSSYTVGSCITDNAIKDFAYYGVYATYNDAMEISGNDISRPTRTTVGTFYGIRAYNQTSSRISRNRIHDPFGSAAGDIAYGIYYRSSAASFATQNEISNNVLYNFTGATELYGIFVYTCNYTNVSYNSISFDDLSNSSNLETYGVYLQNSNSGYTSNSLRNNNLYITRGGSGTKYGVYISSGPSFSPSNYNNYYVNTSAGVSYVGYFGSARPALSNWQLAVGDEANSVSVDPAFVSPSTGNLMPQAASLDNLGTPISGITVDIANGSRSASTPDIGAYEFTANPLPVTLLSFAGYYDDGDAILSWEVAVERNVDRYEIERSVDGRVFEYIGAHEPMSLSNYDFSDRNMRNVIIGNKAYYRLRIVDIDGGYSYSNIVAISTSGSGVEILNVSPNPFVDQLSIATDFARQQDVVLHIYDQLGRALFSSQVSVKEGLQTIRLNGLDALAPAVYQLIISYGNTSVNHKLIKR